MGSNGGILMFGASSMLGWALVRLGSLEPLTPLCNRHTRLRPGLRWDRVNLEARSDVTRLFRDQTPSMVIDCSGICKVDKCETSPQFARAVNVEGVGNLLAALPRATRLVYCSSDHVFGHGQQPFTEHSPTSPISVYGRTRVAAEALIAAQRPDALIVRVGLCVGPSMCGRRGHLDWLRYRTQRGLPMTIVDDEYRSVVWSADAARRVVELARSDIRGVRHMTAARAVSRAELADYLNRSFAIGATYTVASRRDRHKPHLGRVELGTVHRGRLADPLPPVVPRPTQSIVRTVEPFRRLGRSTPLQQ